MRNAIVVSLCLCALLSLGAVRNFRQRPQQYFGGRPAPAEAQPAAPAAQPIPAASPAAPAGQPPAASEQKPAAPSETPAAPAVAPAAAPATPAAATTQTQPWDRYQVLVQDNIFSKVRGRRPPPPPPPTTTLPPERYMVLKGTLGRGSDYVAFVEDTRTNETQVFQAGNTVRGALIKAVGLDGLTVEIDGKSAHVEIGAYVGGAPPGGAAAAPAASEATPSGAGSDLAERMRQKRLKEMGQ